MFKTLAWVNIVLCTSGIKDFVYQRAEDELINRIFNATSAYNILVHGRFGGKNSEKNKVFECSVQQQGGVIPISVMCQLFQ